MKEETHGKKFVKFDANLEKVKYIEKIGSYTDSEESLVDIFQEFSGSEKKSTQDVQSVETQTEEEVVQQEPEEVKEYCDSATSTQKSFEKVIEKEPELTKMDADVGDADLGIGAARAAKNILENLNFLDLQDEADEFFEDELWDDAAKKKRKFGG